MQTEKTTIRRGTREWCTSKKPLAAAPRACTTRSGMRSRSNCRRTLRQNLLACLHANDICSRYFREWDGRGTGQQAHLCELLDQMVVFEKDRPCSDTVTEVLSAVDTQVQSGNIRRQAEASSTRPQQSSRADPPRTPTVRLWLLLNTGAPADDTKRQCCADIWHRLPNRAQASGPVRSDGSGATHLHSWSSTAHRERCWDDTTNTPNRMVSQCRRCTTACVQESCTLAEHITAESRGGPWSGP